MRQEPEGGGRSKGGSVEERLIEGGELRRINGMEESVMEKG